MKLDYNIGDLSAHLFWDVDVLALDFKKSREQIIYKVLEFGVIQDWKIIKQIYMLVCCFLKQQRISNRLILFYFSRLCCSFCCTYST